MNLVTVFWLTFFLSSAYFLFVIIIIYGICSLPQGKESVTPFISIIIAARNEEHNIFECITSVLNQDYPKDNYEVIIVDDRSNDRTGEIVQEVIKNYSRVKLISIDHVPPLLASKKYALQQGIASSTGEIILTTDADCRPQPSWITTMVRHFSPETGLVAGFSPLISMRGKNSFLGKLLTIDSLGLAVLAAGSIGIGWGTTCTGRNLAYRRKVYDTIGGFNTFGSYVSGDDDLLLHYIRTKTSWQIRYAADPAAIVPSMVKPELKGLTHQRIRHASKFRAYPFDTQLFASGIYLLNFLLCVSLAGFAYSMGKSSIPILAYGIKVTADIFVLMTGQKIFNINLSRSFMPIASLVYPFYVLIFGAWGTFGKFQWKGKIYRPEIQ